jgi:hypothetical protein
MSELSITAVRATLQIDLHAMLKASPDNGVYHFLAPLCDGRDPRNEEIGDVAFYRPHIRSAARAILASPEARAMICNWNERVTPHLDPLRFVHRWTDVA